MLSSQFLKYKHKSCFYIVEVKDGLRMLFHFSCDY